MKRKKAVVELSDIVIDAFAVGDYPQGKFTQKELSEIAASYNPENYEAPITIGHISDYKGQTKIPAFGWIGAVKVVGDHLKLVASQFSEELKAWYKEGLYKKVSAAFFSPDSPSNPTPGKWHLHHLAFLGAAPPQVKGLEGIAFNMFGESVAFAEMDAQVSEMEAVEKAGMEDTYENISESFATCLAKIQEALASGAEYSVKQQRMDLALSDCYAEIAEEIGEHFAFVKKIEDMEEKAEYTEHKSRLVELAQKIFKTKKQKQEVDMDAVKQKEYEDKIALLETQNKEFADAKAKADEEAKAAADKAAQDLKALEEKAADDKLRADILQFCEKEGLKTKLMDDLHLEDTLFAVAKSGAVLEFGEKKASTLELVQAIILNLKPTVPQGEMKEFATKVDDDKRPEVIKNAEKYIKAHAKEFSAEKEKALSRALYLHSIGQIKFEGE
jgi:hypothetical protein